MRYLSVGAAGVLISGALLAAANPATADSEVIVDPTPSLEAFAAEQLTKFDKWTPAEYDAAAHAQRIAEVKAAQAEKVAAEEAAQAQAAEEAAQAEKVAAEEAAQAEVVEEAPAPEAAAPAPAAPAVEEKAPVAAPAPAAPAVNIATVAHVAAPAPAQEAPKAPVAAPAPSQNVSAQRQAVVSAALAYAAQNAQFDCTLLATNSIKAAGVNYHGWPVGYMSLGNVVSAAEAQPGDLIYYASNGFGQSHIAVYIGNGQAVHGGWEGMGTKVFSANLPAASAPIYISMSAAYGG
ncbi:NlpC/P60 family protein [Rothia sp. ZJ1223]|uniref:NlpC/P60 family protein n=1 Tax=Rothia sp. ZJ1223 TaxID=2811098 RepID=UPI00195C7100|nr:NlpC/P60 family protein [Rothia sp. ZJ1223]MBM7052144.1 C40 family peptidase [Rothia sp. ZJ1223]